MFGRFTKLAGLLLALSLLGGCVRTPSSIFLGVTNDYPSGTVGADTYCTDGLEASLTLQNLKVESGLIAPDESGGVDLIVPEGVNPGTLLITEAWCYRDGEEAGYVLVEKPYRASNIPTVGVIPPPAEGPLDYASCTTPTETRGVPICIESQLYK